jgi:hypothetical protein
MEAVQAEIPASSDVQPPAPGAAGPLVALVLVMVAWVFVSTIGVVADVASSVRRLFGVR